MCGPLRFLVIRAIYTILSYLMIFCTMCGPSHCGENLMHSPFSLPFTPMSLRSLGVPFMPCRLTTGRSSTTPGFAPFLPHMARFFVSLARIPRNKMVAPNGSFAPSMIVCVLFSSTLTSRLGFGQTPSPPPLSSSTSVRVMLVGTLHHIIVGNRSII